MIISFADEGTEDVFNGEDTRKARAACPINIRSVAARKLDQLNSAATKDDLRVPPGNRLKELEGPRQGEYSIRINDQYRVVFRWGEKGPYDVKIEDYH
jgi:proteic killer suppression protein